MKLCSKNDEFVQCSCGSIWIKHDWQSWDTAGWCPGCKMYSTYDIDMEWKLVENGETCTTLPEE